MDEEWAQFIYNNRSAVNWVQHNYDYVYGGVADGYLDDLIEDMDSGKISLNMFYEGIAKYETYDQLSIHNQNIITSNVIISLIKVVSAYGKEREYVDPTAV